MLQKGSQTSPCVLLAFVSLGAACCLTSPWEPLYGQVRGSTCSAGARKQSQGEVRMAQGHRVGQRWIWD